MRILITFLIGLFSSFYLAELLFRTFQIRIHSIVGLAILSLGFLAGFFGYLILPPPADVLSSALLVGAGIGLMAYHLLARKFIVSERLEHQFVKRHENAFERFLEILPGALTWIALTSPLWLSFALPFALAYLIILADVYWLFNSFKIAALILIGYRKITWAKKQPWLEKLKNDFPEYQDFYHLVVLPTYKESLQVLAPAFDAIASSNFPKDRLFMAVGFEDRDDKDKIEETSNYLKKFGQKIGGVFTTIHPFGLPGEVPGPGSNRNWVIRNAVKEFKKRGIKIEKVIVTTLDADFVIHKEFLSGMLHKYLSLPEKVREKRSFTGVFLYHNNYWQTPTPMRLMATGTSFWQLAEMVGSDKYINYSSLSINLKSLLDIGLWIPDKVNDDSGFYWKAYYHFNGDYKVLPHYLPISADAVQDVNIIKTFQNQYLQLKRWAYGVEHIPFIVTEYFKNEKTDFWDKTDKLIFVLWANLKWTTMAFFITFGGLLIPVINPNYKQSVLAINLPVISSWILTAAFFGLFATIFVHEKTAPPRPKHWNFFHRVWSYLQWVLIPIILVTISTLPAIHAQTSLMLGRYMEFRVTRKARA